MKNLKLKSIAVLILISSVPLFGIKLYKPLDTDGNAITNAETPVFETSLPNQVATKQYVDNLLDSNSSQFITLTNVLIAKGVAGPTGSTGENGITGPTGLEGNDGAVGPTGEIGSQGPQGITGSQGLQGIVGQTGPTGSTGPQGEKGPQGSQGIPGNNGADGATGSEGSQGNTGATGATGAAGAFQSGVTRILNIESSDNGSITLNFYNGGLTNIF